MNNSPSPACAIVGAGRLGKSLAVALRAEGVSTEGPFGRGFEGAGYEVVLLCVPDSELRAAAAAITPGPLVGHCSGATGLDVLRPHEAFGLHPLMTVTDDGASFAGASCAIAGTSPEALALARFLATTLGMTAAEIDDEDRAAYHAAASIASNFLVTLEAAAERLLETTGAEREMLVPLVRATIENWAAVGPQRALTGPIARGDEATVTRQRQAVAERAPELLELFDSLTAATRALASAEVPA